MFISSSLSKNPSRTHSTGAAFFSTQVAFMLVLLFTSIAASRAQQSSFTVKAKQPTAAIQPTMWGIFFEDINFAADGGIYAEMVKNRSFEFSDPLMGWKQLKMDKYSLNNKSGSILIVNREGENLANPRFARVQTNGEEGFSVTNEGFRGMGIKKDSSYTFSVFARVQSGGNSNLKVSLLDAQGRSIGEATLAMSGSEWKKYTARLQSSATEPKGSLGLQFTGKGLVDVDMVSLFPQDTWKHRPNGFRSDLIQLLADMRPGFLRFPGGCIVEGFHLSERYQWKKTVGPLEDRQLLVNRWNQEFKHRPTPDYFQSFGVGFYEYFQLAEDIGAEPLPIISCGMACQFNSAEVVTLDQLDPYVQDALDLIEFANGDVNSKWGKLRNDMGHPAPFDLKFLGVGNEQWGPQYIERYKVFATAIKSRYPNITIVSGTGPFPEGELFDYATQELKALKADIVDEHYYANPDWFLKNATRYDNYDRSGPKIFAGEYAAQSVATVSPENKNTWLCALSEAAFMTGLERNADVVHMASYAPLFAHAEGWQWTPDLIWFDNLRAYGTPNYYVQKLFSLNKGTEVLPMLYNGKPAAGQDKLYGSATWDKQTKEVIIKIVNAAETAVNTSITLEGGKYEAKAKQILLKSDNVNAVNSLDSPMNIVPSESTIAIKANKVALSVAPSSLTILRIKGK